MGMFFPSLQECFSFLFFYFLSLLFSCFFLFFFFKNCLFIGEKAQGKGSREKICKQAPYHETMT